MVHRLHTKCRLTEVRICEATLSRTEEECHPTVRGVRAGESVLGAEKTVALGTGLARERRLLIIRVSLSRTLTTSKTRAYSEFALKSLLTNAAEIRSLRK